LSCLTCVQIFELPILYSPISGIVGERRVARVSQKAANRWLLALMLLRNPSLLRYRRQGGVTRFVDMRSASISAVAGILSKAYLTTETSNTRV